MEIVLDSEHTVLIDDADEHLIIDKKLRLTKNKKGEIICVVYRKKEKNYAYLHQLILGGKERGQIAYFKDGNRLNCRRDNVIYITRSVHSHIKTSVSSKDKKYTGVIPVIRAVIKYNHKIYSLGNFKSEKEAAMAYNRKAIELYGKEEAILNTVF